MAKAAKAAKTKKVPAKRGRPKLPEGEGKRFPINTRTTKELKDRIETAASESGRSVSQEIETRLERSFLVEDSLGLVGAHPKSARFMKDILDAQNLLEKKLGGSIWDSFQNSFTFLKTIESMIDILGQSLSNRRGKSIRSEMGGMKKGKARSEKFKKYMELPPYDFALPLAKTIASIIYQTQIKQFRDDYLEVANITGREANPEKLNLFGMYSLEDFISPDEALNLFHAHFSEEQEKSIQRRKETNEKIERRREKEGQKSTKRKKE